MKKFLSMLTLVLALCLACNMALAAVDYTKPIYGVDNGQPIVVFTGGATDRAERYLLKLDAVSYVDLKNVANFLNPMSPTMNLAGGLLLKKEKTCTEDAEFVLYPSNAPSVRTNNMAILNANATSGQFTQASAAEMLDAAYTFFGFPQDFYEKEAKTYTARELMNAGFTNWSSVYKTNGQMATSVNDFLATGHNFTDTRDDFDVKPDCETAGRTESFCSVCNKWIVVPVAAKGHKSLVSAKDMLTLQSEGSVTVERNNKKYVYKVLVPFDCVTSGSYQGYCVNCGKEVVFQVDAKKDAAHVYGDFETIKNATCTEQGIEYARCLLCQTPYTRSTDAKGHKVSTQLVVASDVNKYCDETANVKVVCSTCGIYTTTAKNAAASDFYIYDVYNQITTDNAFKSKVQDLINGTATTQPSIFVDNDFVLKKYGNQHRTYEDSPNTDASGKKPVSKVATCEVAGQDVYLCTNYSKCHGYRTVTLPALGHKNVVEYQSLMSGTINTWTRLLNGEKDVKCSPTTTPTYRKVEYCANEVAWIGNSFVYANTATVLAPKDQGLVKITALDTPVHKFSAWLNIEKPTTTTYGTWTRTCTVCGKVERKEGFEPPVDGSYTGLVEETDGKLYYYENGEKTKYTGLVGDTYVKDGVADGTVTGIISTANGFVYVTANKVNNTFFGMVDYNGGKFLVQNGTILTAANGLVNVNGEWLFLANGQLQVEDGFAEYDDHWFMIKAGKLDLSANGLYEYMGGKFLFAAGQLQRDYSGLWQDAANGKWYYLSLGQVQTQYTGIVEYDGKYFYVVNGELASGKGGTYTYVGSEFEVDDNGNAYPIVK